MSDSKNVSVQIGPGGPMLLFLVFLVLKLTDVIAWSWWWVTAPLWGGAAIVLGIALVFLVIAALGLGTAAAIEKVQKRGLPKQGPIGRRR